MVRVAKDTKIKSKRADEAGKVLKKIHDQSAEEMAAAIAQVNNLPYIDLNIFPVSEEDARVLDKQESQENQLALFQKIGRDVSIGIIDPGSKKTFDYIEKLKKENGWNVHIYIISHDSLKKVWDKQTEVPFLENLESMKVSLTGKDLEKFEKDFGNLLELKKRIREIPTTQVVSTIMAGAIKMKGSDIHFEPGKENVRLRYRIDGVLQDIGVFPMDIYKFILSRIKMMGKMKINVRDIAQDGHFSIELDEKGVYNVRANIIPGNHGESIVMRLLNQADVLLSVEDLGIRGLAYEKLQSQINQPNGMILTTGPTGSGKTTTLYAIINKLNTPESKIITIEDPIEYEVEGISQTQIAKDRGYTFAEGLRAIVRQDPDIILVGEIRDEETSDISVNAALTGHLVLSTLHANNAAASIPRFIELGVKPNLIAPSVNAFIAQRLVRKLCDCKEKYKPAQETISSIKKVLSIISPKAKIEIPKNIEYLYRPVGCSKCHKLGYKGRIGIFEILTISENIEKLILEMAGEREIAQTAIEEGMIMMAQDGILKAVEGITSMDEVWRATGQNEFLENIYEKLMEQSLSRSIDISKEDIEKTFQAVSSIEKLSDLIKKTNQKDVAKYIFASSLLLGVGDIHVEPEKDDVKIRYRIDGILQTITSIPLNEYPSFLGEIKFLSGLKSDVREGVKDSRFTISLEEPFGKITETKIDVRVSIILGGYGETIVMRLLNKSDAALDLEKLGIRKQNLEKILEAAKKPNGIFLNTGPTGSGKTTTLYSILGFLNKPEVKIITVEDPIEYQLEGILQTQVNEKDNYGFSTALRALLRQNPDIMMIGEIRDEETAQIAVQAALTGHEILSTLHSNNAAGSVHRLLNMGISGDDLAIASNAFMAQRLVRKLCDCKEKVVPNDQEKQDIEKVVASISKKAGVEIPKIEFICKPKGCSKCNNIGYKGRTTISEVLVIDRDLEELISHGALSSEIQDKSVENGMITMQQDGILKVLEGETTLEEVKRVVD